MKGNGSSDPEKCGKNKGNNCDSITFIHDGISVGNKANTTDI